MEVFSVVVGANLIAVTLVIVYVIYMSRNYTMFRNMGIRGPPPWPCLGNLPEIIRDGLFVFHRRLYSQYSTEKVYGYYDPGQPVLVIRDLEMIKAVCVKHFDCFVNHRVYTKEAVFGHILPFMKDEQWKRVRNAVSPAFAASSLKRMSVHINRTSEDLLSVLLKASEEKRDIELKDIMSRYTLDTIAGTGFGVQTHSIQDRGDIVLQEARYLVKSGVWSAGIAILFPFLAPILNMLGGGILPSRPLDFFAEFVDDALAIQSKRKARSSRRCSAFIQIIAQSKKIQHTATSSNGIHPSTGENTKPKSGNTLPKSGNTKPKSENTLPKSGNTLPKSENTLPKSRNTLPKSETHPLKDENQPPKNGNHPLKDENQPPKNGNHPSKSENQPPKNGNHPSKGENQPPKNENHPSKDDNGRYLSYMEIQGQALAYLLAGFDSVSTALSFTLFLLAYHPEYCQAVQEEIDSTLHKDRPNYSNVQDLTYLDMCINESLRMFPPGVFQDRVCNKEIDIEGFKIKKNSLIVIPVVGVHYDPVYWPEPEQFDPTRFTKENKSKRHPFSFLPFGHGPRNCIGQRLALLMIKICLADILQQLTPEPCAKSVYPVTISNFLMGAKDGLWVKMTRRSL